MKWKDSIKGSGFSQSLWHWDGEALVLQHEYAELHLGDDE